MKKSSSSHHLDSLPSPITKRAKNCCFTDDSVQKRNTSRKLKALDSLPKRVVRKARELEPTTPPRGSKKKSLKKNYGLGSLNSNKNQWMSMSLSGVQIRPSHQNTSFRKRPEPVSKRPLRFQQRQEESTFEEHYRSSVPKRQIPTPPEPPLNLVLPHCARTGSTPPYYDDRDEDEEYDDDDFIAGEMITPEKIESSINSLGSSPVSDSKNEVLGLSLAEYIYLDTLTSSHKKAKPLPANHYNQPMMCSPPNKCSRGGGGGSSHHKPPISVIGSIMRSDQKSRMQDAAFSTLMQTPCRSSSGKKASSFFQSHDQQQQIYS
eukprot:g1408.t1